MVILVEQGSVWATRVMHFEGSLCYLGTMLGRVNYEEVTYALL